MIAPSATADGVWSEVSGPFLDPRYFHTAVFDPIDREIVLYGGRVAGPDDAQPWAYSVEADRWRVLTTAGDSPAPRWQHVAIMDPSRHRMIVYGGGTPTASKSGDLGNEVWSLTLGPMPTWTQLHSDSTPPATFGRLAVHDPSGDRMIMIGCLPGTSVVDQAWVFDLGGGSGWQRLGAVGQPPPVRDFATAIYDPVRDRLVMFGGIFNGVSKSDTWELSLGAAPEWRMLSPGGAPPAPRFGHTAVYDPSGDRMIIGGDTWWSLGFAGDGAWSQLITAGTPPATRAYYAEAALDPTSDRMFVLFGLDNASNYLSDVPVLDLSGEATWVTLEGAEADVRPAPRTLHGAVHDPGTGRMLVVGGYYGFLSNSCPRGEPSWFFHPSSLSALMPGGQPAWPAQTASGPVPGGRQALSLVYDSMRRRVVMFGGLRYLFAGCDSHSGYARYRWESVNELWTLDLDPALTWTQLVPPSPAPAPRGFHASIYDPGNDRVIVSGGRDPVTGAEFSDTWSLSLGGAPTWTALATTGTPPTPGSELQGLYDPVRGRMLVFGSSDGRILQLSLDAVPAWTELVTTGGPVPPPRRASVCYDSRRDRVILFGGLANSLTNDVWALSLSAGSSWTWLTPAGGLPPARSGHTAIYQPEHDRMIVFGGDPPTEPRQVAGRRDTWILTWDSPTATEVSRIRAVATARRVNIDWWVSGITGPEFVISRRVGTEEWTEISRAIPDGTDIVRFEDSDVTPGARMSYRLGQSLGGEARWLDQVELLIPRLANFGLGVIRPNPAGATASIEVYLPDSGEALLEIIDLAGRVVRSQALRDLGPGSFEIQLTTHGLPPGVYLARLSAASEARAAKLVILR